jgi:hypothetical protein
MFTHLFNLSSLLFCLHLNVLILLLRCTNRAGPFVLGSQDKSFLLDDTYINFPEVPSIVPYLVDWILSRRHQGAWRFNCSDMYGNPRPFPNRVDATSRTYPVYQSHGSMARVWSSGLISFVLLLLCVFAAVKLGGLTSVQAKLGVRIMN